jgi:retinol dehydrogenase 12
MDDQVCVVTGGSSGIGHAACRELARRGLRVVLTSRTADRAAAAKTRILDAAPDARVEARVLDLESLASTRRFAAELLRDHARLDVLVHNAGAVYPRRRLTEDGFEAQLAVIHLGPLLLTHLLEERLRACQARVVHVVSDLHKGARLDLDDLHMERARYGYVKAFRRAELLKVLCNHALARRLADSGVTVNCVHPGGVRTRLFRELRGPMAWLWWLSGWLKQSPRGGARGVVHLATAGELAGRTGLYFKGTRERRSARSTYDEDLQDRAWEACARAVGLPYATAVLPCPT